MSILKLTYKGRKGERRILASKEICHQFLRGKQFCFDDHMHTAQSRQELQTNGGSILYLAVNFAGTEASGASYSILFFTAEYALVARSY